MFLLDGQQIDLSPDREIATCIKCCFPGPTSFVETFVHRGDDGHNGAVQCSLTAWSFYLHISIWEDTFDGDFVQDLRFMKKGIKSPMNLFQPRLVQRSEGITFILTSEEEQYRKDERRRKVTIQKKKITVYLSVIARKEFTTSITVYSLNYLITL